MAPARRKNYNKLVRDRLPELIMRTGEKPIFRRVQGAELKTYASAKILEGAKEFKKSSEPDELVDLLEAIYFRLTLDGISAQQIHERLAETRQERGGFEGGIVLEHIEKLHMPIAKKIFQ